MEIMVENGVMGREMTDRLLIRADMILMARVGVTKMNAVLNDGGIKVATNV
jgi:hypothetical protein